MLQFILIFFLIAGFFFSVGMVLKYVLLAICHLALLFLVLSKASS
jgi:hypothetical protein